MRATLSAGATDGLAVRWARSSHKRDLPLLFAMTGVLSGLSLRRDPSVYFAYLIRALLILRLD